MLPPPDSPLTPQQLSDLRCPADRRGLPVLVGLCVLVFTLLPPAPPFALLLLLVGVVLSMLPLAGLLANGVPVGRTVAPTWAQAAQLAARRTGVNQRTLPVVLVQNPQANAFFAWAATVRGVAVTSGAADLLDGDNRAQLFILAHEYGHALFHAPWSTLAQALPQLLGPFAPLARLPVLFWVRGSERSADRLGVVVCGSPLAATRALLVLHGGSRLDDDATLRATLLTLPRRRGGPVLGYLSESVADHPFLRPRLEALFHFCAGPEFAVLVGGDAAERARAELATLGVPPADRPGSWWPG